MPVRQNPIFSQMLDFNKDYNKFSFLFALVFVAKTVLELIGQRVESSSAICHLQIHFQKLF
jgi:hypothetical protein